MSQEYFVRKETVGYVSFIEEEGCYRELEPIEPSDIVHVLDRTPSSQNLSAPLQIVLYPGLQCNINCSFCYLPTHRSEIMSEKTIKSVLQYMQKNYVGRLQILGGEPFHPHLYPATEKIIQDSEQYPAIQELTLTTNGYYLHEVDMNLIKHRRVVISVSLHGIGDIYNHMIGSPKKDVFTQVKMNLDLLRECQQTVQIVTVVTSRNIDHLHEIKQYIDTLPNVLSWTWLYPNIHEMGQNQAPGLKRFMSKFDEIRVQTNYMTNLNMPFQFKVRNSAQPSTEFERSICRCSTIDAKKLEIMPDGTVYHCCMFFGKEEFVLGNINNEFNIVSKYPKCKVIPKSCSLEICEYYNDCYGCLGWASKNGKSVDNRCVREYH